VSYPISATSAKAQQLLGVDVKVILNRSTIMKGYFNPFDQINHIFTDKPQERCVLPSQF